MDEDLPITSWIRRLKEEDEDAAENLWHHFFSRLCHVADQKMPTSKRAVFDQEDAAGMALASVIRRTKDGRLPTLKDRHSFWHLLITVAERKAINLVRNENRKKRGAGECLFESLLITRSDGAAGNGFSGFPGMEPTPSFIASMNEGIEHLMGKLDATQQETVTLKLEGWLNTEIAEKQGCSVSSVERRLKLIRAIWTEALRDEGT